MTAADEMRTAFAKMGEGFAMMIEENEMLKAKLDTANALVTCCCGQPVDTHGMGDGHSPVDMYHYHLMRLTEENDRLKVERDAAQKDAVIAWSVCASVHRQYAKGRDALFKTRQSDFAKHEDDARAVVRAAYGLKP